MLTHSYFQSTNDPFLLWAQLNEWMLRELAYRKEHPDEVSDEMPLAALVPAQDAGDVCGVCGTLVTWVDHLPPLKRGDPVRCYRNVVPIERGNFWPNGQPMPASLSLPGVEVDDIFPRV